MCFSANASFIVSGTLLAVGIASAKCTRAPNQVPFALIPVIFSVQQFFEGMLWLALAKSEYENWQNLSTYSFLVFAQVVWPVWVPFSIYLIEKNAIRKKILAVLSATGVLMVCYTAYCIFHYPIKVNISDHHIYYDLYFPHSDKYYLAVFYLALIVLPPFISSVRKLKILIGPALLFSFIWSKLFFAEYVVSVWCFFAAVISVFVFLVIRELNKPEKIGKKSEV